VLRRALFVSLVLLGPAPGAFAATAEVSGGKLLVRADSPASEGLTLLPTEGAYLLRSDRYRTSTLTSGPGCAASQPRELRCSGDIQAIDVQLNGDSFATERLRVPLTVTGGDGNDGIGIGGYTSGTFGSTAPVTIDAGGGRDNVSIRGLPRVSYMVDGGPGNDTLAGRRDFDAPGAAFTLRGGDGNDNLTGDSGADELDGGAGNDTLRGNGGDETVLGGSGTDTVIFAPTREAPVNVTLDGQRNDGAAGENALVADVENVTLTTPYDGGPAVGDNTVIGDDGPNVLVGAGVVRGMGGDDVLSAAASTPNELDGGDGNDRISARVYDDYTQYVVADRIECGSGDDVLLTDRRDPRPADCERFDLGLRVIARTAKVGPGGRAAVRVRCDDVVPCTGVGVALYYKKHLASVFSREGPPRLAPGASAIYRTRLNRWLARPGRFRRLTVTARAGGHAGGLFSRGDRVITLIRTR
jgi:hypothetical protein